MMEPVQEHTILNMEEELQELGDEEAALNEATCVCVCEQLHAVIPQLDMEALVNAFWQLAQSMSHTYSQPYLEATEDIMTTVRSGDYARCFYTASNGAVLARYHSAHTFLVDARADFVYAHVIDQLLLQAYDNAELMAQAAHERFERRAHYYKPCPLEGTEKHGDGDRVCPMCWVVYTRVDSLFYKQARARIVASLTIDFSETIYDYMDVEHLSFQLVLFLCGSQLLASDAASATSRYEGVNQWVKVPVWWLLLQ